jgi:hypothetical protein
MISFDGLLVPGVPPRLMGMETTPGKNQNEKNLLKLSALSRVILEVLSGATNSTTL